MRTLAALITVVAGLLLVGAPAHAREADVEGETFNKPQVRLITWRDAAPVVWTVR